jgi:hypothetical protein
MRGSLDATRDFCVKENKQNHKEYVGYWWKAWGGGYGGCCTDVDYLTTNWPDASTYSIKPEPEDLHDFCKGHADKVQFADINGDGKEDIVCDIGGSHWAKLSAGDGTFTDFMTWHGSWCAQDGAVVNWVDITGDGIAEMLCFDPKTGSHWAHSVTAWNDKTV